MPLFVDVLDEYLDLIKHMVSCYVSQHVHECGVMVWYSNLPYITHMLMGNIICDKASLFSFEHLTFPALISVNHPACTDYKVTSHNPMFYAVL